MTGVAAMSKLTVELDVSRYSTRTLEAFRREAADYAALGAEGYAELVKELDEEIARRASEDEERWCCSSACDLCWRQKLIELVR